MDYSAFYPSILINYFLGFAGMLAIIIVLVCGVVYLLRQYMEAKALIELIGTIVIAVLCVMTICGSLDSFKDLPNIVNKNYTVATGIALGWNTGGKDPETRTFEFKKDDGGIIDITVFYTPVYQGDRFEVIYLPNTGCGAIVRKLKEANYRMSDEGLAPGLIATQPGFCLPRLQPGDGREENMIPLRQKKPIETGFFFTNSRTLR